MKPFWAIHDFGVFNSIQKLCFLVSDSRMVRSVPGFVFETCTKETFLSNRNHYNSEIKAPTYYLHHLPSLRVILYYARECGGYTYVYGACG